MKVKLLLMAILPVFLITAFTSLFARYKITNGMRQEAMLGLQGMANCIQSTYDGLAEGEYAVVDGDLMKGDFNITQNMQVLDQAVAGTDYEVTIFYGKTRMATTLVSSDTGERIIGTDANDEVVKTVLDKGKDYENFNTRINGKDYFVYYVPIKDDAGNVVGMVFTGVPSSQAKSYISSVVRSIIFSAAAIEVIIILILC